MVCAVVHGWMPGLRVVGSSVAVGLKVALNVQDKPMVVGMCEPAPPRQRRFQQQRSQRAASRRQSPSRFKGQLTKPAVGHYYSVGARPISSRRQLPGPAAIRSCHLCVPAHGCKNLPLPRAPTAPRGFLHDPAPRPQARAPCSALHGGNDGCGTSAAGRSHTPTVGDLWGAGPMLIFLLCGRPACRVEILQRLSSSLLPPSFAAGRRTTVFTSTATALFGGRCNRGAA